MMNNTPITQNHIPTIVSVAEATHYLVGIYDNANNFTAIDNTKSINSFPSLFEAKEFLRKSDITSAHIEYHTAYDEMCGAQTAGLCTEKITL